MCRGGGIISLLDNWLRETLNCELSKYVIISILLYLLYTFVYWTLIILQMSLPFQISSNGERTDSNHIYIYIYARARARAHACVCVCVCVFLVFIIGLIFLLSCSLKVFILSSEKKSYASFFSSFFNWHENVWRGRKKIFLNMLKTLSVALMSLKK